MWESSEQDSTDEHSDLPEVISRNIRHRIDPSIFDRDIIMGQDPVLGGVAQKVLHYAAVIAGDQLPQTALMPGDFFYELAGDEQERPATIWVV